MNILSSSTYDSGKSLMSYRAFMVKSNSSTTPVYLAMKDVPDIDATRTRIMHQPLTLTHEEGMSSINRQVIHRLGLFDALDRGDRAAMDEVLALVGA